MRAAPSEPLARHALAFVLAGGRGSRLLELTDRRAKPAVYFGGKSRIIDFALSNAMNSGIRRIAVATQYKAHSLIRHCRWAGISFGRSATKVLIFCRRASAFLKPCGMSGLRMRSTKISTSSNLTPAASSWSWPATMFTKWTTRSCLSSMSRPAQMLPLAVLRCRVWRQGIWRHACR